MEKDLTKGSILKNLFVVSMPTMIGFSFQMVYDLVDLFWIGKISSSAIAGVTVFTTIFWVIEAVNEVIGVSSISLISQSFGKKEYTKTGIAIEQTIGFKFTVAIGASVFFIFFLKPILGFFMTGGDLQYGLDYGYLRIFFLPLMFSSFSINTALRSIGDAKTPMKLMIVVSLLNMILDPIFMFDYIPISIFGNEYVFYGLNYGIKGAAYATIISQTLAFLYGGYILFRGKGRIKPRLTKVFHLKKVYCLKLIKIGLPNGFEVLARNLASSFVLKYVTVFGSLAVAAFGIGGRIFGFAFMPLIGLNMGGASMVGQCLGAEKLDRARKTAYFSAVVSATIMVLFSILAFGFGDNIVSAFTKDAQVIKYGQDFLIYGSFGLIFIGIAFGLASVFSGSGYNFPFFVGGLVSKWMFQIPFLIICISVLHLNITFVWLSYVLSDVMEFVVGFYFYKKGKWLKYRA